MKVLKRILMPILGVVLVCCEQTAGEFVKLCSLQASRIIPVMFDHTSGEYIQVTGDNDNTSNGHENEGIRFLRSGEIPSISVSERRRTQQHNSTGTVFYVRKCVCPTRPDSEIRAFCPLDKTTCGIPRDPNQPVACFNQSSRTSLIRNAWPVVVLWYGGLCIFLLFTTQGRNARHFVVGKCCRPNLNESLIEHYWYIDNGFWRRRRRRRRAIPALLQDVRQRAQERRHLAPRHATEQHPPNQLVLKTKRYVAPDDAQDEDDTDCTICFSPLEDGDRVGALPCHHSFHVNCLKEWLRVRNICPLCQATDVAAPQYQPHDDDDDDEGEENSLVEGSEEQSNENDESEPVAEQLLNDVDESNQTTTTQIVAPPTLLQRTTPFRVNWHGRRLRRR